MGLTRPKYAAPCVAAEGPLGVIADIEPATEEDFAPRIARALLPIATPAPLRYISLFSGVECASLAFAPLGWEPICFSETDAFASAVLAHRYPDVPNVGDVTKHDWMQYKGQCDLVIGGPPCFVAGTLILTRTGLVPIEDVTVGTEVFTHCLRWRKVTATMRREAETVVVKGQGHIGIETTAEHPFWARKQDREWIAGSKKVGGPCWKRISREPEWVEAAALRGQYWSSPAAFPATTPNQDCLGQLSMTGELTPEVMWVVGCWLGDGWTRFRHRKQANAMICAAKYQADELEGRIRAAGFRYYRSAERTTDRFALNSRPFVSWLVANFGQGAKGKSIPTWVLGAPRALRQALYDGYRFADGHRDDKQRCDSFATISKALAMSFRLLVNSLGRSCTMTLCRRPSTCVIEERTVNQCDTWQIRVFDRARSAFFDRCMAWGMVRKVIPQSGRREVWNIEVDEDNSYVADGLVVHNCQSFSLAGLRGSLGDERGNLSLAYVKAVHAIDPRWSITENVPGWLSTSDNAFGCFLAALVGADAPLVPRGIGWRNAGVASGPSRTASWRIINAEFLGVAQRRRRVFVVSCRGSRNWRCAAALFPQSASLPRHSPPSREEGARVTSALGAGSPASGERVGGDEAAGEQLIAAACGDDRCENHPILAHSLTTRGGQRMEPSSDTFVAHTLSGLRESETAGTLRADASRSAAAVRTRMLVRRLLPIETERLQGLPPNWTLVPYRGKPAADGPRYRAVGNGFAVPVVAYIARQIAKVEAMG